MDPRDQRIAEQDQRIAELKAELAAKEGLEQRVAAQDQRIAGLEAELAIKNARIADLEREVAELKKLVAPLLDKLGRNSRNSHLWCVHAPSMHAQRHRRQTHP